MMGARDPRSLFEIRRLIYKSRRNPEAKGVLLDAVLETFPTEFAALVKAGRKQMQGATRRWERFQCSAPGFYGCRYHGERPRNEQGKKYFERTILIKPSQFELTRRFDDPRQFYSLRSQASEYLRASREQKKLLFDQENTPLILRRRRRGRRTTMKTGAKAVGFETIA
jgi:hypothetical protein